MIKWLALIFAMLALFSAADERKVRSEFDIVEARLKALERAQCVMMVVLTPGGRSTICAPQL